MSLLFNVVVAGHARGTHHRIVLDSLLQFRRSDAVMWQELLLSEYSSLLAGSKAPDDDFRDFRNHVLHVNENFWGGAVGAAEYWYGQLVDHLRAEEWKEASWSYGVLSHYYSDPLMPLHTAQSESEGAVHRAAEWSVSRSYDRIRELITTSLGGYPEVLVPNSDDWLGRMVREGALKANAFYEVIIDHYDLEEGIRKPEAGLDEVCLTVTGQCIAYAVAGLGKIFEMAVAASGVVPPPVSVPLQSVIAAAEVPLKQILNRMADHRERKEVEAIFREVKEKGKAISSLPDSERLVRRFHAEEVLNVPLTKLDEEKPRPSGLHYGQPMKATPRTKAHEALSGRQHVPVVAETAPKNDLQAAVPESVPLKSEPVTRVKRPSEVPANDSASRTRRRLRPEDPIVDAPSIGPKTALRFEQIGIHLVSGLLDADAEATAKLLSVRHITADVIRDWRSQAELMICVDALSGRDAQLLVAAGIRDAAALSRCHAEELLEKVDAVVHSSEGRRILRESRPPVLADVAQWVSNAMQTYTLAAKV
jgi:hypothetical protein